MKDVDQVMAERRDIEILTVATMGTVIVPSIPHKDRKFGGHLMINPRPLKSKEVHHVSDLMEHPAIWLGFQLLCSIVERAMLEVLPCLNGEACAGRKGVTNFFEAGNWGLHYQRSPIGPKDASAKKVHAHLFGRSPLEPNPPRNLADRMLHWGWGEAPYWPEFMSTPFAPPDPTKIWLVPEQFNVEEQELLRKRIQELVSQYYNLLNLSGKLATS
jgi:hypothetical protein